MATQYKLTETDFETGISSEKELTAEEVASFGFSGKSIILEEIARIESQKQSAIQKLQGLGLTLEEALALSNNG